MESQHGLITSRQLAAQGVTHQDVRRLLNAEVLVRVRHGVYADAEVWQGLNPYREQPLMRVRAAALTLKATSFVFSHDSAAIMLGMGAPRPEASLVHVTRPKVHGDAVRGGVKHHLAPYSEDDVVEVGGLRLLGPARTALDMAREHGRVAGLAACDAALRDGTSRRDLDEVRSRMRCWPRSRIMRWCAEMADGGAETYLESQGRDLVLELGIGRPETQFGLTDGHRSVYCDFRVGRHIFEVDGELKYGQDNPSGQAPKVVVLKEKQRQDFITGFKLGASRITAYDCGRGRGAALRRLNREFSDTCDRFGTSIDDLAPYVIQRPRPQAG
jgi:hypothetical protein